MFTAHLVARPGNVQGALHLLCHTHEGCARQHATACLLLITPYIPLHHKQASLIIIILQASMSDKSQGNQGPASCNCIGVHTLSAIGRRRSTIGCIFEMLTTLCWSMAVQPSRAIVAATITLNTCYWLPAVPRHEAAPSACRRQQ